MDKREHPAGVCEAHLVVRHLKLEGLAEDQLQPLTLRLAQTFGVDEVTFDAKSNVLNIAYDATHCDIDRVEQIVREHGADIGHGWWTRFKEGYYRFVDSNIEENQKERPTSCHDVRGLKPVPRVAKASRRV